MADATPRERLRYALSYLESARTHAAANDPAARGHVKRAEAILDRTRRQLGREATRLGKRLQAALRDQDRLSQALAAGRIDAAKANAANRRLTPIIAQLRAAITDYNSMLAATAAAELDGFVELPLDDYSKALRPPEASRWMPTPLGFVVWLACVVAAVVGVLTYEGVIRFSPSVSLEVGVPDPATGTVAVRCRNNGLRPVIVCVPWPEEGLADIQPSDPAHTYGLILEVREQGSRQYRPASSCVNCWSRLGLTLNENTACTVAPGLSLDLVLSYKELKTLTAAPDSLRVVLAHSSGSSAASREIALPR